MPIQRKMFVPPMGLGYNRCSCKPLPYPAVYGYRSVRSDTPGRPGFITMLLLLGSAALASAYIALRCIRFEEPSAGAHNAGYAVLYNQLTHPTRCDANLLG